MTQSNTCRVVALFTAKDGCENQALELLTTLIDPTRREKGCMHYEIHRNLKDPKDIVFIEEWASEEDLDRHLETPHIQEMIPKIQEFITAMPDIRRYQLIK